MRLAAICLLLLSPLGRGAAASREIELKADLLLGRMCDALLAFQEQRSSAPESARGALECRTTNPVPHGYHTRGAEAVFPFALRYQRTGRFLNETLQLGDWLVGMQLPEGSWLETPHSWWGTTAHELLALAASMKVLATVLGSEEQKARRERWIEACRRASDFIVLKIRPGDVPLSYLPTAACALRLAAQLSPGPTWEAHAAELVEHTLGALTKDGLFIEEGREGVDVGISLGQTIPALALYAILARDDRTGERAARIAYDHLVFLWPDGSVDAGWGSRMHRWTIWGSFGAYGPAAGFALLSARNPVFREAADRSIGMLGACLLENGLAGYGPWAAERGRPPAPPEPAAQGRPAEQICLYPTVNALVGLAMALYWGDLAGPTAPLPHEVHPACRVFPSVRAAVVHTGRLSVSFAWPALAIPGVYQPRGGSVTHLLYADIGTVQCATPSLFVRPESLHLPRQRGTSPLTPRIEFRSGERWYSNIFDAGTTLESYSTDPPQFVFRGELCDMTGKGSGTSYRLTYAVQGPVLRKTLEILGRRAPPGTCVLEPMAVPAGAQIFRNLDGVVFNTPRGGFELRLLGPRTGVVVEVPPGPPRGYFPLLPAVKTLPVQLRFLETGVTTARWEIKRME
ncbi:MAG TPA: hypothetical protein DCM87_11215 [Planctomycetes bacterium]|nr:hypothetical protein [Planctomycetota bacterium]